MFHYTSRRLVQYHYGVWRAITSSSLLAPTITSQLTEVTARRRKPPDPRRCLSTAGYRGPGFPRRGKSWKVESRPVARRGRDSANIKAGAEVTLRARC
ncbi:hypothetical protein EVAR_47344_1 [Eumeta japonica]|uniref:Uncharacterized protein n=1 Tax=Eumeta variegata TaxID=151549 RepID=A0A4C1WWM9_EUMVA|nr:hypothetical protein EVAR_47344_1 [Eumeta japonica]